MQINKIGINTNFGIQVTDDALKLLRKNGATDFDISTLLCQTPTDAVIGVDSSGDVAYIKGKYAHINLESKKLTMKNLKQLCEEYNIRKFFSVESSGNRKVF